MIFKTFNDVILSFDDGFSGYEKLFQYTRQSGYVRNVPNKSACIGLWHYQGSTVLKSGDPYL
eukprot:3096520-Ditylum_brightwellii.AAC.1